MRILEMLDVDVAALRVAVAARKTSAEEGAAAGRLVLAAALEGAVALGHTYLGSEHLLLGLATETGSAAGGLLTAGRLDAIERRLDALERRSRGTSPR